MKLLLSLGTVAAIAAPIATLVSCGNHKLKNFKKFTSKESKILDVANEADINLFFTPAIAPFTNLMRLSILDKTENHFYLIKGNSWEATEGMANPAALTDFYNNKRVGATNINSSAEFVSEGNPGSNALALNKMKKIIEGNPTKKINIWWNVFNIWPGTASEKVLSLSKFNNVNLQLLEDGATNYSYKAGAEKIIKDNSYNSNIESYPGKVAAPLFLPGVVRSWWSNNTMPDLNAYAKKGAPTPYNYFEYKTLSDLIFETRDKDGARLMATWVKVSGLNWEHEADKVSQALKDNGHKSLIILGSYGVAGEEQWIKDVWKRYHAKYNIFYKGHPGHLEHPLFVTDWINKDHPDGMYQLEPMISSEELTRDHAIPKTGAVQGEKYIQFDKVAVVNHSSAVSAAAFPNLDINKDVIEVYDGAHNYVNPSEVPTSTNWAQQAAWLKTL